MTPSAADPPAAPIPREPGRPSDATAQRLRAWLQDPDRAPELIERMLEISQEESYSGPIPHPDHLREIEAIVPGAARELIEMARSEQRHRHRRELRELNYPYAGLVIGFLAFLASMGAGVWLAAHGYDRVALAAFGVPVLGVIGWFVQSRV